MSWTLIITCNLVLRLFQFHICNKLKRFWWILKKLFSILFFQINFCIFTIFQNDFGKINPKLGPAIPPYNAHFDQYSRQYFKYKGLRKTLIRTGQVSILEIRFLNKNIGLNSYSILIFIYELSNFWIQVKYHTFVNFVYWKWCIDWNESKQQNKTELYSKSIFFLMNYFLNLLAIGLQNPARTLVKGISYKLRRWLYSENWNKSEKINFS